MTNRRSPAPRSHGPSRSTSARIAGATLLAVAIAGTGDAFVAAWGGELGPGSANHPVGVVPSGAITVPTGWPLDRRGAITCLTCHERIPDGPREPYLREFAAPDAPPIAFCAKCHRRPLEQTAGSMHWIAMGVAHVSPDQTVEYGAGSVLDSHTRQCLSCHDGATATESKNVTHIRRSTGSLAESGSNHPVGILYDDISRDADLSPLRPASSLPAEVPLPGGRVACISCHNLYAGDPFLLTVPIDGSALCFTCHDMN